MCMLASLRAYPRLGVSSSDFAQEQAKARELFDRAIKALEQDDLRTSNGHVPQNTTNYINDDLDIHVEIALNEALRLSEANERIDPRLFKKAVDQDVDDEQLFRDEIDNNVSRKRLVRDDDDEEAVGGPRKKQYKSKEILSDTNDEEIS
ncbi:hypothetical protein BDR05DRAFT_1002032 [Suillus weaverae]|nr:hypothetical protein BDR05DRAFT_1002032 [Suillus weaverae]